MTTILIAEDNAMVGLLMQTDLEDAGYEVRGPFATTAPATAAAEDGAVALALLDIDLAAGDSGIELAEALRAAHATPCLFVTGQSYDAAKSSRLALGALTKPFASSQLVEAVAEALRRAGGETPGEPGAVAWF